MGFDVCDDGLDGVGGVGGGLGVDLGGERVAAA